MFKIYDGREHFYQWDLDRKLIVSDPSVTQVHFCNRTDDYSLVCETYVEDGITVVNVPNILLQTDWKIYVYAYDDKYTKYDEYYEVKGRAKPADYVYTETEVLNWEEMKEAFEEMSAAAIQETKKITDAAIKENKAYIDNVIGDIGYISITYELDSPAERVNVVENHGVKSFTVTDLSAPNSLTGAPIIITFTDGSTEQFTAPGNETLKTYFISTVKPVRTIEVYNVDCSYVITKYDYLVSDTVKGYSDKQDAETLSAAKNYADKKDVETLENAKSYTDEKNKAEITSRVHFDGDIVSLPGATGGISRIKFYANGYPTIESGSPLSVRIYNGSDFLAEVYAPVGFGGDDYLEFDSTYSVVEWIRGYFVVKELEADDFISKMAEADSFFIYDVNAAGMAYADVTYTATVSAKLDSEIERAKSAESEVLENAKSYADTKAAAAEENAKTYGNQTFAGALKGEKLGSIVRLDDVSALDRRLDTVVSSKNIMPFPYTDGMSKTLNGVTFTVSDDGSITVNGTATGNSAFYIGNNFNIPKGYYTLSGVGNSEYGHLLSLVVRTGDMFFTDFGSGINVNAEKDEKCQIYIYISEGKTVSHVTIKPQLELGTSSTAYTKHVSDLSGVSLKKFGKNLIPYPYAETTKTVKGLNFTDNGDGSVTVNGTATADAAFYLKRTSDEALPRGTYFLSGCPKGGAVGRYNIQPRIDGVFNYAKYDVGSGSLITAKTAIDALVISVKSGTVCNNLVFRPQLELGGVKTAFESPGAPTTYTVGADGTVQNLSANEDVTTLVTDNDGTVLKTKYSRELSAAFTEIQNAIIALGGSF